MEILFIQLMVLVSMSNSTLPVGSSSYFTINVDLNESISGMQTNIEYDNEKINIISVSEGNLFNKEHESFFNQGTISSGNVLNIFSVIIGNYSINESGIFSTIVFNTLSHGNASIRLYNTKIADTNANLVDFTSSNSFINIYDNNIESSGGGGGGSIIPIIDTINITSNFSNHISSYPSTQIISERKIKNIPKIAVIGIFILAIMIYKNKKKKNKYIYYKKY